MAKKILVTCVCLCFVGLAFFDVAGFVDAGRRGLSLFSMNVLPVLFPFFFVTSLMVESGVFSQGRQLNKSPGRIGITVWFLSILSGFPTSARMLGELYKNGRITRASAMRISTFTSTPSPIFVVATVGTILYGSTALGVVIFMSIIFGALANGLIYTRVRFNNCSVQAVQPLSHPKPLPEVIAIALQNSIQSILAVGGLIVIFFILGNQLDSLLDLPHSFDVILSSLLEMTNGVFTAAQGGVGFDPGITFVSLLVPVAILAFGGLCVGMQGLIFAKNFGMPFWFYLLYKSTHTVLSIGVALVLLFLLR